MTVNPTLNRQLIAERLGWPEGALEACTQLELAFPRWLAYWSRGGIPLESHAGYRAKLRLRGYRCDLYSATAEQLAQMVAAVDADLPAEPAFPTRLTPLVEPDQK